jgi:DNA repair protein RecO (recombination protein O)
MARHITRGIVLQKINYSETSLIIKMLTPSNGVQSFIFPGAKRKKKHGNLVQSLAILSVEYYQRSDSDLPKITAIEPAIVAQTLWYDPYKSSILFFMNEVLLNTLRDNERNDELYHFLENILQVLDHTDHIANFPAKFLYRLTRYLGFAPEENEDSIYLDLQECRFTKYRPNHLDYLDQETTGYIKALGPLSFDGENDPKIPLQKRRQLVYDLLKYYHVVIDQFKPIQSLAVLEATFHE